MHELEILDKNVRILNYQRYVRFKDLKSNMVGQFVSVKGTAVRVSSIKPLVTRMEFRCALCDREQVLLFPDGKYQAPAKCVGYGCKSKVLLPQRGVSSKTQCIDWQRIRLQEKLPNDQSDAGRVPRIVDCEVTRDLVDKLVPGDVVVCTGVVKLLATEESKGRNGASQMYYVYIDVNSMGKLSGGLEDTDLSQETIGKDYINFSDKDIEGIQEIFNYEGDLFHLLVHSVCPAIFGHELVKAAILLTLFGGRKRNVTPNQLHVRSDSHLLIVGDPGLGKSQMLLSAVKLAPRGVYLGANTATTAGLTVTVTKDSETGDTTLEAGALVLGDQGVCCIDEFDKMSEHHALLEAMEQQSISIAKAGMVCTLPTRTSIIAAANPVGGHYDNSKTVSENLKMNSALLSRFDLVFILLDQPNEDMDRFLSEHIIKMHSGEQVNRPEFEQHDEEDTNMGYSLKDRLKKNQKGLDLIPPSLLRKYISYARTYCQPGMSQEASETIRDFYLELRR
jgi:DNA helicase MCM8